MNGPWYADEDVTLYLGDCLDVLRTLKPGSVDAIVTDPPAGIAFMGRDWDDFRRARHQFVDWLTERMAEAYRVLKPGGHALVWSIPRTSHWTAWAIEDAGFDIRDCVLHLFGSGFPKSLDVSKAIDRAAGAEREAIGPNRWQGRNPVADHSRQGLTFADDAYVRPADPPLTAPATEDAARWAGFGTALKPGQEMWWLARKPLKSTVAANVLEFGTGALNVDGCRVGTEQRMNNAGGVSSISRVSRVQAGYRPTAGNWETSKASEVEGRWPTNILLTHSAACNGECAPDCPVAELDRQSGAVKSSGIYNPVDHGPNGNTTACDFGKGGVPATMYADTGGASRFYPTFRYAAKAPASERPRLEDGTAHETVKSLDLMRWLVRLVTPPGGTVLDLYAGSGATAEACVIEGFRCILIEQRLKSAELIRKRLSKPIQPVMFSSESW